MSNHKYCDQCGQSINKESKFCASCGFKIKNQFPVTENVQEIKNTNHLKKEQENKKLTKEEKLEKENAENKVEMSRQVNKYETLKITESVRGKTVIFMLCIFLFNLFLSLFGIFVEPKDVILEILIYSPVLFFIYNGHRWASVALMVLWTIEKIVTLGILSDYVKPNIGTLLIIFTFWIYVIRLSLANIEIENLRIKNKEFLEDGNSFVYEKDLVKPKDYFCSDCNIHYSSEDEVCPHCNNEVSKKMDSKENNNFKMGDFKFIIIGVISVVVIFLLIAKLSFSDESALVNKKSYPSISFEGNNIPTKEINFNNKNLVLNSEKLAEGEGIWTLLFLPVGEKSEGATEGLYLNFYINGIWKKDTPSVENFANDYIKKSDKILLGKPFTAPDPITKKLVYFITTYHTYPGESAGYINLAKISTIGDSVYCAEYSKMITGKNEEDVKNNINDWVIQDIDSNNGIFSALSNFTPNVSWVDYLKSK